MSHIFINLDFLRVILDILSFRTEAGVSASASATRHGAVRLPWVNRFDAAAWPRVRCKLTGHSNQRLATQSPRAEIYAKIQRIWRSNHNIKAEIWVSVAA